MLRFNAQYSGQVKEEVSKQLALENMCRKTAPLSFATSELLNENKKLPEDSCVSFGGGSNAPMETIQTPSPRRRLKTSSVNVDGRDVPVGSLIIFVCESAYCTFTVK